jgi:hypothetical protein
MEKKLFQNLPENDRMVVLEDNADSVEIIGFLKQFTVDELAEIRSELVENLIQIQDLKNELKEVQKQYKDQIEPLAEMVQIAQEKVRLRAESVKEKCYKLIDHEARMVGYYDRTGNLVLERPLGSNENQTTIISMKKAVNQ